LFIITDASSIDDSKEEEDVVVENVTTMESAAISAGIMYDSSSCEGTGTVPSIGPTYQVPGMPCLVSGQDPIFLVQHCWPDMFSHSVPGT